MDVQNRRSFLKHFASSVIAIAAAAAAWGTARFSFFESGRKKNREISEEVLKRLETDAPLHVPEAGAWLRRTNDGELHALDDRCPHLGCRQKWNPDVNRFQCPCHGSEFDVDGNVKAGPATKALSRLTVDLRDKEKIRLLENR